MTPEKVIVGRNDPIRLTLKEGGVVATLASVTRVTLVVGATTVDSDVAGFGAGQAFDVTEGSGVLVMRLGTLSPALTAGLYPDCRLTLYDATNTSGVPWGALLLRVVGAETYTHTYATAADMIARYGQDELVQLTDFGGVGELDDLVLAEAITEAEAEVDAYIGQRYALPLDNVPAQLERIVCELARYRLYRDGAPDAVRTRYEDARRYLEQVATGKLTLGLAADASAPTPATLPDLYSRQVDQASAPTGRVFSMHDDHKAPFV